MKLKYLSAILVCMVASTASATIDIVLTKGKSSAIPLGISQFTGQDKLTDKTNLAAVMNSDLENSGEIRPTLADGMNTDIGYWRGQGADDIVTGSIAAYGTQYQIAYQLNNLFDTAESGQLDSRTLSQQSFTVRPDQFRALAHHLSDDVFQRLTGVKGVASTKLAYVVVTQQATQSPQYRLEISDADGANAHTILTSKEPIMSPVWSPDAQQLAYVSFEGHRARLFMQNLQTGQRQILSQAEGINNAPAFSPDGKTLALVLSKSGNPKIYLMDLASGKVEQLTQGLSIDTEPAWLPDGKAILFTSNRGGTPQVYRKDLMSGQVTRLTYEGDYNARPRVLPDGSGFVVMHRETGMFGIATQSFSDSKMHILSNEGGDESPSISPNGRQIIYATRIGGRGILAIVAIDGDFKMRLPARNGDVQEPAWSPFIA